MSFSVNQEKQIDNVLKSLLHLIVYLRKSLKPVWTRPSKMYELCKVKKDIVNKCLTFRLILSTIKNPTNKLPKFLVPVLKSFTNNVYTVKESFTFVEKIVDQDSKFFIGNLYADLIFTNIPLEGTIDIYTNALFKYNEYNELSDISSYFEKNWL